MKYRRMKFTKILQELDSEEKARIWVWAAKFDGKNFLCPKCQHEEFYPHKKKALKFGSVKIVTLMFDLGQTQFFNTQKPLCWYG